MKHSRKTSKPKPIVCAGCVHRGYTPKDLETYTCEGCDVKQGQHKFAEKDIQNKIQSKKTSSSAPHARKNTPTRIGRIAACMAMHVRQQTRAAKVHGVMQTLPRPMSRLQSRRPLRGHQIPTKDVSPIQLRTWPLQQRARLCFLSSLYHNFTLRLSSKP